jgi:hypothetical protein
VPGKGMVLSDAWDLRRPLAWALIESQERSSTLARDVLWPARASYRPVGACAPRGTHHVASQMERRLIRVLPDCSQLERREMFNYNPVTNPFGLNNAFNTSGPAWEMLRNRVQTWDALLREAGEQGHTMLQVSGDDLAAYTVEGCEDVYYVARCTRDGCQASHQSAAASAGDGVTGVLQS